MSEEKPRLEAASNGYQVHHRGRRLYAAHDPRGGAARRAAAAEIQPQTLVIVASPLLGYGLRELLDICPPDAVVLAVELDPALAALPLETTPTDDRLLWARAPAAAELDRILERALSRRPRRTRLLSLSGGFGLQPGDYRSLAGKLDDEIRIFWQNAMTRMRMGRLWIRNLFRNLPLMPASTPLESLRTSLPIVVVGAGPSLDDRAAELPRDGSAGREQMLILAVDTAVAPLAARGITPDFILAVESQQANATDFLTPPDVPETRGDAVQRSKYAERCPHLICDITAYPGVLHRAGIGGLTFVSSRFAPTALFGRLSTSGLLPPGVPPLGSVGVLGVHLAARLTTDAVYFTGLDFSYDLERTHARGAPMQALSLARRTRLDPSPFFGMAVARPLLTLEGKDGRPARSDTVLLSYAEQLRSTISRLPEGSVYDLSPDRGLPNAAPAARGPFPAAGGSGTAGSGPHNGPGVRPQRAADAGTASPAEAAEVDAYLDREESRLSELILRLRDVIGRTGTSADVSAGDYAAVRPLLADLDYVYLDFPDPPAATRSFLGRVLLSALDYEGRVRRVKLMRKRMPRS
ncbi:MAG: 6-hydroxymethylpterin diphosphokinase MptE-like protein [Spirochaetia bacterium]